MVDVSAKAGVASDSKNVADKDIAAALAARRGSAPMIFPQPVINFCHAVSWSTAVDLQWMSSECVGVGLAGSDPQGVIDRRHENLAVADLAGARAGGNDLDRLVRKIG